MSNCSSDGCSTVQSKDKSPSQAKAYMRPGISFVMLMAGIIASAMQASWFTTQWVQLAWYILAYIPVGIPVLMEAWESIRKKDVFSEYTLMSIATIGAFFIGEYPEGVAVMLFYAVGELFQSSAINRAKRNISALLDVRPETATVIKNDTTETMPPEKVEVGQTVEVKVGERVPLDGKLQNASAAFNTSALTGESTPRMIRKDEEVLAGMIVTDSVVRVTVTKPFGQSALARILELVQNAIEKKRPSRTIYPEIRTYLHPHCSYLGCPDCSASLGILVYCPIVYIRFQRLGLQGLGISGYFLPVRIGHQHSLRLFRRNRCSIATGDIV